MLPAGSASARGAPAGDTTVHRPPLRVWPWPLVSPAAESPAKVYRVTGDGGAAGRRRVGCWRRACPSPRAGRPAAGWARGRTASRPRTPRCRWTRRWCHWRSRRPCGPGRRRGPCRAMWVARSPRHRSPSRHWRRATGSAAAAGRGQRKDGNCGRHHADPATRTADGGLAASSHCRSPSEKWPWAFSTTQKPFRQFAREHRPSHRQIAAHRGLTSANARRPIAPRHQSTDANTDVNRSGLQYPFCGRPELAYGQCLIRGGRDGEARGRAASQVAQQPWCSSRGRASLIGRGWRYVDWPRCSARRNVCAGRRRPDAGLGAGRRGRGGHRQIEPAACGC